MHCYSGSAAQTWVSQLLCWGGRAMFVLQTRYNSAFLPSSPLNSIVATLDEITEGKKSVIHSVRSEMSWCEHLCYNCYLVWSRSRGTFWKKKITQITIIYNGDSNQITITKNRQKSRFPIKWSAIINTLVSTILAAGRIKFIMNQAMGQSKFGCWLYLARVMYNRVVVIYCDFVMQFLYCTVHLKNQFLRPRISKLIWTMAGFHFNCHHFNFSTLLSPSSPRFKWHWRLMIFFFLNNLRV